MHLKHTTNFKNAGNIQSSNVVECECELHHIPVMLSIMFIYSFVQLHRVKPFKIWEWWLSMLSTPSRLLLFHSPTSFPFLHLFCPFLLFPLPCLFLPLSSFTKLSVGLQVDFLWPPYVIGQAIIFCPVVSFFIFYLSFFSTPNLSGRMLDVYHTLTHGVALVRI